MTQPFCTHLFTAHVHPQTLFHHYDNCTLLLGALEDQCKVISDTTEERPVSTAANLCVYLCQELTRRLQLLYDCCSATEALPSDSTSTTPHDHEPTAAALPRPEVLQAERFELVDRGGRIRAVLGFDTARYPGLWLYDRAGGDLASFCLNQGDPYFYLSDGNIRLVLGLEEAGPRCTLSDDDGHTRLELKVDRDGTPSITTYDTAGNELWSTPAAQTKED